MATPVKAQRTEVFHAACMQGFPSGGGAVAALAFHGGILAMLLLYTAFWWKLNILQTLPLLAVLGLFTAVAGYYNLSNLAGARLKKE